MPEGRPLIPRIRMPRITRPGRGSRAAGEQTTATKAVTKPQEAAETGNGAEPATKAQPGQEAPTASATEAGATAAGATAAGATAAGATGTPAATKPGDTAKPAEAAKPGEPTLQERVEGLQGWMAIIERRQARIKYFGGLALLLALGAAGAALYFGLNAHSDSATKKDLDALTNRVNSLQGAVTKNSKDTQNALNSSIAQLQQSIGNLQKQQSQASANISTLQSQIASGALNAKNATTPGTTPVTPGTATTSTPNAGNNGKSP